LPIAVINSPSLILVVKKVVYFPNRVRINPVSRDQIRRVDGARVAHSEGIILQDREERTPGAIFSG